MTAQQRIQAIVVGVMPWIMLIIMFLFQPATMKEFYFSPIGFFTLVFCTIWIGIGMKVVNKLGDISV
jgi:tight adherence protein B